MGSGCCNPTASTLTIESLRTQPPDLIPTHSSTPELINMVKIPAGTFLMGTNSAIAYPFDGESPQRTVDLDEYWIDETSVTNLDFARFANETGYQTEAELLGWSFVPDYLISTVDEKHKAGHSAGTPWWIAVNGANWRHPLGPNSSLVDILDHPVVHVSWEDANAFARWCGKRLPTEAEWEKAASGGLQNSIYPWGNELETGGMFNCNIWQGDFPGFNSGEDGYLGTAPAYSYAPNGFGLYNLSGNVWEWCSDWWSDNSQYKKINSKKILNPKGPATGETKIIKGGSFLCHESYCNRYRISARTSQSIDGFSAHIGFRCAASTNINLLSSM